MPNCVKPHQAITGRYYAYIFILSTSVLEHCLALSKCGEECASHGTRPI